MHVSTSASLHQGFPWLHPSLPKFTIFRVCQIKLLLGISSVHAKRNQSKRLAPPKLILFFSFFLKARPSSCFLVFLLVNNTFKNCQMKSRRIPRVSQLFFPPFSLHPSFHSSRFLFVLKVSPPCRLAQFDNSLARVSRRVRISRFLLGFLQPLLAFILRVGALKSPTLFLQVFSLRKRHIRFLFLSNPPALSRKIVLALFLRICIQNQTHTNLPSVSPKQKLTPSFQTQPRLFHRVSFLILTLFFTFTFHLA